MEIIAQDFGVISIDIGSVHIYIVDSFKVQELGCLLILYFHVVINV